MNKSTLKTVEVLEIIANTEENLTASEISKRLNMPKSSTHDILVSLLSKEYICLKNKKEKTYELGLKILQLSNSLQEKLEINQIVIPYLKELKKKTDNTIFFAVEDNFKIVYLGKFESDTAGIKTTAKLGSRNGLYYTGLGKAILATFSEERLEEYLNNIRLEPRTTKTLITREDLVKDLIEIRKRGYSIDNQESEEDVYCIAVPIYDINKNVLGAISTVNLFSRINEELIRRQSQLIINTAIEISKKYGYNEKKLYSL